jgi:hypothetical protein
MFLYILLIFPHWGPCVRAGLEGIWAGICINTLYIITLNEYTCVYVQIRTLVIFKSKLLQWQIESGLREGFVHQTSLDIPSQLLQLKARPRTCKRQPGNLRFRLQAASVRWRFHHDIVQSNAPPKMSWIQMHQRQRQLRYASTKPPTMGPRTKPPTNEKTTYATAHCWVSASHISAHSQGGGTFCGRKTAQARQTTRGPKLCQSGGKLPDVHEE